jgi:hypothetical protein
VEVKGKGAVEGKDDRDGGEGEKKQEALSEKSAVVRAVERRKTHVPAATSSIYSYGTDRVRVWPCCYFYFFHDCVLGLTTMTTTFSARA